MIFSALINNITLIIALSILYSFIIRRWKYGSRTGRAISGFLFGAVAVVGMMNPLVISPGLIFDGRSIIISIAGFLGGWVTALIAALMAIIYRAWLGGPGAIMGVSVISSSAAIGIAYHYIRRHKPHLVTPLYLIGFGIIVHICMLALTMTLPSSMKYEVLSNIAIPVIIIYPLGTLLVCVVLLDLESRLSAEEEKKVLQERLQHADKMEAIGTLAGGIAHDFNNLLMGIQGYASMTLMNIDESNPNYERLKKIEEQVQSGADLTSQLLGFARGGRYEIKPTDINEIIEKTSSMFGRTKKEIAINRKTAKDLWNVEVDRGQMEQVFLNLYVNAWQAMPGGGNIYLETQNAFLNDEQALPFSVKPGKHVKITITDTGTGMDEKTKERIFDPFFTTKAMGRGTGLGLATVYGIIKGHHGLINVYSEPGHGTTFTIYLPATDKEISKEKAPIGEIVTGTETILLVDDEKMVMEVNRELLASMGYKVYAAGSGQEGIAVYMEKRDKIDLVILDMIMPGISGSETFDRLRKINPKVKVLLSSGYSLNGEAKHIMDRGCNGFLHKPFRLEELSGKVREMLG